MMTSDSSSEFLVFVTIPGTLERFSERFARAALVGRSEECDVRLPHALVSRRHAELSRVGAQVVIRDLDSRNGTIVEDSVLRGETVAVVGRAVALIGPYALVVTSDVTPDETTLPLEQASGPLAAPAVGGMGAEPSNPHGLSAREIEVIGLLAKGRTNQEIGEELVISPRTVHRHVSNILNKTGLSNRTEAATWAERNGLVT